VNFQDATKLSSDFFFTRSHYLQIIRKLYSQLFVISVALARMGTILPVVREITPVETF